MKEFEHEIKMINSHMIFTAAYQRDVKPISISKILKEFNPNTVNPPKVSFRDGKYWVFNGQHTISALKERNGGKDLMIQCIVYYGMTYEDEAHLFALQDGHVVRVAYEERLRGEYEAKNEDVIAFKHLVESFGLVCDFQNFGGSGRLVCYKAAFTCFKKYGADHLSEVISIALASWGADDDGNRRGAQGLRNEMINGLSAFIHEYQGKYDKKRLISNLSYVTPAEIIRRSSVLADVGARKYEHVIVDVYNKGKRKDKLIWRY